MWTVQKALGTSHPALGTIAPAVAKAHLAALVELVGPGGRLVLVLPDLELDLAERLAAAGERLDDARARSLGAAQHASGKLAALAGG